MCVYVCVCGDLLMCIVNPPLPALKRQFPFSSLYFSNYVSPHREKQFVDGKLCLFHSGTFTIWVERDHRNKIDKFMVEKAKAITENRNAPCVVRKEMSIDSKPAHELLQTCGVARLTVMQYGQKAEFSNKVVAWVFTNVRGSVCLCV